jgi:hypothetical protein
MGTLRQLPWASVLLALVAGAAYAEQTGEIRGTITDPIGAVLADVKVTARSPSLQGVRTTASDARGFFRLPLLPAGTYTLTFERSSFERLTLTGTEVPLGYTATLSVGMRVRTVTEEITVAADPPLIDRTTASTSYRLTSAALDRIPTQDRTIADIVGLTPGITGVRMNTEMGSGTGLPSFRGEGNAGNNWLVDGLSVKGVDTHDSGLPINFDAWDEVQIVSDGFEPQFGQALGGTVNIVTKSGGDAFHGELGGLLRPFGLRADMEDQLSAASLPQTSNNQFFGNLGGPILNRKLWFFISNNYVATSDRTQQKSVGWLTIPAGERKIDTDHSFGKLTWTPRSNHTLSLSGALDSFLSQDGGIGLPETYTKDTYTHSLYRLNYMGLLSRSTFVTASLGRYQRRTDSRPASGDTSRPSYTWQDIAQSTNNALFDSVFRQDRTDLALSASTFLSLGRWGQHEIKGGLSHYANGLDNAYSFTGAAADPWKGNGFDGGMSITWAEPQRPVQLLELGRFAERGWTRGFGVWAQDTITLGRFSLMLGLRSDTQVVENDVHKELWNWGVKDFVQPRASLAVDLFGTGRSVLRLGYGRFSMPMSSACIKWFNEGGSWPWRMHSWVGPENPTNAQLLDPAHWQFVFEQSPASVGLEKIDANLRPNRISRFLVGLDQRLGRNWALRARGVFARGRNLIEDITVPDPQNSSGLSWQLTNLDLKRKDYRSLEVELNGTVGEKLKLDASYTWSQAKGTVPGNESEYSGWGQGLGYLYDGGPFGDQPDLPAGHPLKETYDTLFAGFGGPGVGDAGWYGFYPYSVDHIIRVLTVYHAPYGVDISTTLEWLSGYHWEKKGWSDYGGYLLFPEGRGVRTTPAHAYLDLALDKHLQLRPGLTFALGLNVANALNRQRPVSFSKEDNELFGRVWARQQPRRVQLKAALRF